MVAVKDEMTRALADVVGATLTRDVAARLRRIVKLEDGWARGKRGGLSVLPQGEASEAGVRLLEVLRAMGVHVVTVGELERWAPAVGGHGPAWVAAALEARVHEATGPHVDFVQQLLAD